MGDRAVVVGAARQRVVLATLALAVGRVVRIDELIGALWGDGVPATAVKTAQTYVARLRQLLPDGTIVSAPTGYALAVDPESVDAARFERAVAEGTQAIRSFDYEVAIDRLGAALGEWRDDPIDLGDQRRGIAAAARLRELRLGAEDDLADAHLALGAGAELVADLEAAVREEELRERRWGNLMVALYRSGRQADALRAYQRARAALVDGLGIEPGAALRAVERAVIDRSPTLLAAATHHPRASSVRDRASQHDALAPLISLGRHESMPAAVAAITAAPIVGRPAELEAIAARLESTEAGARAVVVVHGEPGIGKTRLVAEAAKAGHDKGALVVFGRCEREALTPYQFVVDALRPLLRTMSDDELGAMPQWEVAELARLVPELGERLGLDPGPIVEEAGARHRLFESVTGLLRRLARGRSLVVVVDDLQWIDRAGGALLRHVVRSAPPTLLLVVTHRSGDAASDVQLAGFTAGLPPELDVTSIALGPLDRDAIVELAGGDDDAVAITEATGGIALFVTELLRFRSAVGRLPQDDELPAGIHQAVVVRVASLDASASRLVEAAAVAPSPPPIAELAAATALSERDAVDALDRAIDAHVLAVPAGRPGAVTFTHDLVRSAVLRDLSPARHAYLHQRLAEAIIGGTAPEPAHAARAAEIAHHLAAAAGGEVDATVARWASIAARHALGQLAWETAVGQLELALAHVADGDLVERSRLLAELGHVARIAGQETEAKARYLEAIAVARAAGDTDQLGAVVLSWTEIPVDVRRELPEVIAVLRGALDDLPDRDSPLRAQLTARLAYSMAWAGDRSARSVADAAVEMARRTGDAVALGRALQFSTSSRDQFEAFDPAGCAGELHALADSLDDPILTTQALFAWFVGSVQRRDRDAADRALYRMRRVADHHHLIEPQFRAAAADAHLALIDRQLAVAARAADELLEAATRSELANLFLFAGALQYDVMRAQGRLAELLPWFDAVADAGEQIPRVAAMHVQVLAAAGRVDVAQARLAAMTSDLDAVLIPAERPHSIVTLAEVAADLGDVPAARALQPDLSRWRGLTVYDGVNGPLEPADRFLDRLDALLTPSMTRPGTHTDHDVGEAGARTTGA